MRVEHIATPCPAGLECTQVRQLRGLRDMPRMLSAYNTLDIKKPLCTSMKTAAFKLLFSVCLAGCATIGPTFEPLTMPADNQGVLYIYRPEARAMSVLSAVFEVDGRKVATLENNGYAAVRLPPGSHTVTQQWKAGLLGNSKLEQRPISRALTVQAGKAAYVRLAAASSSSPGGAAYPYIQINTRFEWAIDEVPETTAIPELSKTRRASTESP